MKHGITGLFSLTGFQTAESDLKIFMGNEEAPQYRDMIAGIAVCVHEAEGFSSVEIINNEDEVLVFSGYLDPAHAPGNTQDNPKVTSPAVHVANIYDAVGAEISNNCPGEWQLLRWKKSNRTLTLIASQNLRGPLYYTYCEDWVAVSPSLKSLVQLDWVENKFDQEALLFCMGRAKVRRGLQNRSIIKNVWQLEPSACIEISAFAHSQSKSQSTKVSDVWQGTFDEAVEETKRILRLIMRQHLSRLDKTAVMLSGGLDSSAIAWMVAMEAEELNQHCALISIAPPGSDLQDEKAFSDQVAQHLGLLSHYVVPDEDANPFRPSQATFELFERPQMSQRHYLYDALYEAAAEYGATAIFDGVYGEMSLTAAPPLSQSLFSLRRLKKLVRQHLSDRKIAMPLNWFHVRLATEQLSNLPAEISEVWNQPEAHWAPLLQGHPVGYAPNVDKSALQYSASTSPELEHILPFRDHRLLDFVATLPGNYFAAPDHTRVFGRAVLKGQIPDEIRLRPTGLPFSPDYNHRLTAHAVETIRRIGAFKECGADEWIDLVWLKNTMMRLAANEQIAPIDIVQAQATAIAAEFFVWWKD